MATEPKRGCGFRKAGGLYLVGDPVKGPCHRLPMPLDVCPVCGQGVKQTRGWIWIKPLTLLGVCTGARFAPCGCSGGHCCVCSPRQERSGLKWVGKKFYSPESWTAEAVRLGPSMRISAVPRDLKLGETVIYVAHPKACRGEVKCAPFDEISNQHELMLPVVSAVPGIFHAFVPRRVEKLLTRSMATEEELKRCAERRITPILVPDDDPDHNSTTGTEEEFEALQDQGKLFNQ